MKIQTLWQEKLKKYPLGSGFNFENKKHENQSANKQARERKGKNKSKLGYIKG